MILVNGASPYEGRIEVYYGGKWGSVCREYWDLLDANVVCRTLGYEEAIETFYDGHDFGTGNAGLPLLLDLTCNGYEANVADCLSGAWQGSGARWTKTECFYQNNAAVRCKGHNTGKMYRRITTKGTLCNVCRP